MIKPLLKLLLLTALVSVMASTETRAVDSDKDRLLVSGYIMREDSVGGLPYAHVTTLSNGKVYTAGPDGYFVLYARKGENLLFASSGYQPQTVTLPLYSPDNKVWINRYMARCKKWLWNLW